MYRALLIFYQEFRAMICYKRAWLADYAQVVVRYRDGAEYISGERESRPPRMKRLTQHSAALMLSVAFLLAHCHSAGADELYKQFSLSGANLTSAPADAKAPEPGIVTAKYGFKIAKDFMPYMGTGISYSYQPDARTGDITRLRTGVAAQLGFNYLLGENLTFKVDYKYLTVTPEQPRGGDPRNPPQSLGIGLDIKF